MDIKKEAGELDKKGRELMQDGRLEEAEEKFKKACQVNPSSSVLRNNLATIYFYKEQYKTALDTLSPFIHNPKDPNPYGNAMAARCYYFLGYEEKAQKELDWALENYKRLIKAFPRTPKSFREYSTIILQAAPDFNNHRLIFDLYRELSEHHLNWINHYYGAVAAFNLGRYERAIKCLKKIKNIPLLTEMLEEIKAVENDLIPPFQMGYRFWVEVMEKAMETGDNYDEMQKAVEEMVGEGTGKMALLAYVFKNNSSEDTTGWALRSLIEGDRKWGEELGEKILQSGSFSSDFKYALASILVETGIYQPGEPIKINDEGEEREMKITQQIFTDGKDENTEEALEKARILKEEGKLDEALNALSEEFKKDNLSIEVLLLQAEILISQGQLDQAKNNLDVLEKMDNTNPQVCKNFFHLWIKRKDFEKAQKYLNLYSFLLKQRNEMDLKAKEEIKTMQKLLDWVNT